MKKNIFTLKVISPVCLLLLLSNSALLAADPYNSAFEIVKYHALTDFKDFSLQYSTNLKRWDTLDTNGLGVNYFYGGLRLLSNYEDVFLRFQKIQSELISTNNGFVITNQVLLRSDIYKSTFHKKRTHFLDFEMSGITNTSSKTDFKNVKFSPGKPPVYYYSIDLHYETITNGIENNSYQINIDNISQRGNTIHLDWHFPQQQPSIITYFVGIGFMGFGVFTNVPTVETSCAWLPPRTGKYWCMIRAEDSDDNSYFSEPVPFVYIDPNDSGETDSDNDGFNDIEELLRNSDPDDPLDVPIIICDTNVNLEVSKDIYFYRELSTKMDVPVFWEYLGILPEGISLSSDGMLCGVPKETGVFDLEITANSLTGNHCDSTFYRITIAPAVPSSVKIGTGEIKVVENE